MVDGRIQKRNCWVEELTEVSDVSDVLGRSITASYQHELSRPQRSQSAGQPADHSEWLLPGRAWQSGLLGSQTCRLDPKTKRMDQVVAGLWKVSYSCRQSIVLPCTLDVAQVFSDLRVAVAFIASVLCRLCPDRR